MKKDDLDREIDNIHRSTRTHFASLSTLHNKLRLSSKSYYNWHLNPRSDKIHKIVFVFALFIAFVVVYSSILNLPPSEGRVLGAQTTSPELPQNIIDNGYSRNLLY